MNILFMFAHMDDEAFGPAGTITKLVDAGHEVTVSSMCSGRGEYPNEDNDRRVAFRESCTLLGAKFTFFHNDDLSLNVESTGKAAHELIKVFQPEVVYTHFRGDLHREHRMVAEAAMVACRPTASSCVKELYMCETAVTPWSFGQITDSFTPDTYEDVTSRMLDKIDVLKLYKDEIQNYPDARSVDAMESLARFRGSQVGVGHAEAFKTIFRLR